MTINASAIRLLVAATFCVFGVGCAIEAQEDESDVNAASVKAILTHKSGGESSVECHVYVDFFEVKVPGATAAVTRALNDALYAGAHPGIIRNRLNCDERSIWTADKSTVSYNNRGILSVKGSATLETPGKLHDDKMVGTHTLDLLTGDELSLSEVLTPAGRAVVAAKCEKAFVAVGDDPAWSKKTCADAVTDRVATSPTGWGGSGVASYLIEANGLRLIIANLPFAEFEFGRKGIFVSWAALKGNISHKLVSGVAKAAGG